MTSSSPATSALSSLKRVVVIALVACVALGIVGFTFGIIVPPGKMGVRQINLGPGSGIATRGLEPGLHWRIPFYSDVYILPQSVQLLNFHRAASSTTGSQGGEANGNEDREVSFGSLDIQTSDRATIDVDATILFKLFREPSSVEGAQHGGPQDLIKKVGTTRELWINKVRRVSDDAMKRALGSLATGQFYDPHLREKQLEAAIDYMNHGSKDLGLEGLHAAGIQVDAVLIRRYTYRDERIENAIFQKNLQDQEEALNIAEGKLSEAQARSADTEALGDAQILTLAIQGKADGSIIRSEAELYETKKRSEADLEVAKARAERDRLKATALAKSIGAEVYVARELVPLVGSLKGGIVTSVDPYDLDAWLNKLGVNRKGQ